MKHKLRQTILLLGDSILLYIALFIAISIRHQRIIDIATWNQHWPAFSYIFGVWIIIFYIAGFYTLSNIRNDLKFYITATRTLAVNTLLAISFFYVFPHLEIAPKTILGLTGVVYFLLLVIWRRAAHRTISSQGFKRNVLVLGNSPIVNELAKLLQQNPQLGYTISATLSDNKDNRIPEVKQYSHSHELNDIISRHHITTIIMDGDLHESPMLVRSLYEKINLGIEYLSLTQFYENVTKKIPIESINHVWFLENLEESNKRFYEINKRIVDILLSVTGILCSIILMPIFAAVVAATSGRPIFFTQTRLGKNGKPFRAIKLRTMVQDAEKNGPQWAQENDPRITPIGGFLRKTRLDELPQLLNVLKGEMTFVGPRPERPEFVTQLARISPFYRERLLVRPGLTGWAQVNFRYGATADDAMKKLQYDLYYVKNRSLILDLAIILKTIKTVLSRSGR